tara:strand:- start:96 stop:389 length:294 start_codon:yes stop_codon:yes gene_type:complete
MFGNTEISYIFVSTNNQKHRKMLISESRNEKYLQEAIADDQAKKITERNEQTIKYLQSIIEKEKKDIKDCLTQNFFSMAKQKIVRIEEMTNKINSLR